MLPDLFAPARSRRPKRQRPPIALPPPGYTSPSQSPYAVSRTQTQKKQDNKNQRVRRVKDLGACARGRDAHRGRYTLAKANAAGRGCKFTGKIVDRPVSGGIDKHKTLPSPVSGSNNNNNNNQRRVCLHSRDDTHTRVSSQNTKPQEQTRRYSY